ncbi:MAG: DUF763 domain-containing protein [Candidatus Aenigmarchaeota archaeon]|nr:DUF763 domain-containing protein [Candidatus Aenigmarchaeota archaeon]
MRKTGNANLPLHPGHCPAWLFKRMKILGKAITEAIILEYDQDEFLKRLSNPFWFQALACVLGFDWHSSGTTTTVLGALKESINPEETGLAVTGGKGRVSRRTPHEIKTFAEVFGLPERKIEMLVYSSRMSAKIDNTLLQDGFTLYHHVFVFTEKGEWCVVQQGMNERTKYARRYHWLSKHVESFVNEPHEAICSDMKNNFVLDMTARSSEKSRQISLDLVKDNPEKIKGDILMLSRKPSQSTLNKWFEKEKPVILTMPRKINWEALNRAYDIQPKNYEEFVSLPGIGPNTVRALALISDIIYGKPPSWKDPVKFNYAHGGKDGVPYPVDRHTYDKSIEILKAAIENAKLGKKEKLQAIRRLENFI